MVVSAYDIRETGPGFILDLVDELRRKEKKKRCVTTCAKAPMKLLLATFFLLLPM